MRLSQRVGEIELSVTLALVPGLAFGLDRHVRISYALGRERIEQALERLGAFVADRRG